MPIGAPITPWRVLVTAVVQSSRGGRSAAIFSSNQTLCVYGIARNTASWLRILQLVVVFEIFATEPRGFHTGAAGSRVAFHFQGKEFTQRVDLSGTGDDPLDSLAGFPTVLRLAPGKAHPTLRFRARAVYHIVRHAAGQPIFLHRIACSNSACNPRVRDAP
jgi:hypothetical protein